MAPLAPSSPPIPASWSGCSLSAEEKGIQDEMARALSGLPSSCGRGPSGPVGPTWNQVEPSDAVEVVESSPEEQALSETQLDVESSQNDA